MMNVAGSATNGLSVGFWSGNWSLCGHCQSPECCPPLPPVAVGCNWGVVVDVAGVTAGVGVGLGIVGGGIGIGVVVASAGGM
eukprot:5607022-Ditylum_brightwellii.AAC.1